MTVPTTIGAVCFVPPAALLHWNIVSKSVPWTILVHAVPTSVSEFAAVVRAWTLEGQTTDNRRQKARSLANCALLFLPLRGKEKKNARC